ncbi:ABC transporter ATP-binding protein [Noviherbaspirillum cavernae]|uniref:ABC transporter ATP-binding protein n=1 Tax=Noviherbaspirillum cavernae TaxID=2320862 RepID=A0A418X2L6_9BURK|nr:ABC transporter ATP-binding protein [Noviherbaspirillum cavernae]RJG06675.1 ABC transporter ATP-binding protein [Noviherbaspirillum cavernae]
MTQAILELRDLVKRYGGLVATDHVNLAIHAGEIHAIIGPNGAGKTTLIHQISGALAPDSGSIKFAGKEVTRRTMHERVAAGLVRSYQITNIFRNISVLDNLALAVQAKNGSSMRFWRAAISESALFEEARAIAERVGLGAQVTAIAGNLAHGEQRKLEVGLALATAPRLLLLDEPMAGLAHEESASFIPLIESLVPSHAVLLIEHDMDAVFRVAHRISVLVAGRIIASGTPDEIRGNEEVRKAYLGDEVTA